MSKILMLDMVSGRTHNVVKVRLHPEPPLLEAFDLRQRAMIMLQGKELGLGYIGSIEWVLAARAVSAALESWLNRNNFKEAADLLALSKRRQLEGERDAQYVPVDEILNLQSGEPATFRREPRAVVPEEKQEQPRRQFAAFGPAFDPKAAKQSIAYIHTGATVMHIELDCGVQMGIEWSHVEGFRIEAKK